MACRDSKRRADRILPKERQNGGARAQQLGSEGPRRVLGVDENDKLIDRVCEPGAEYGAKQSLPRMIPENLSRGGSPSRCSGCDRPFIPSYCGFYV
jgi:hypothetical protein